VSFNTSSISTPFLLGWNPCRVASAAEFTELINKLKRRTFHTAEAVMPLTGRLFPA